MLLFQFLQLYCVHFAAVKGVPNCSTAWEFLKAEMHEHCLNREKIWQLVEGFPVKSRRLY